MACRCGPSRRARGTWATRSPAPTLRERSCPSSPPSTERARCSRTCRTRRGRLRSTARCSWPARTSDCVCSGCSRSWGWPSCRGCSATSLGGASAAPWAFWLAAASPALANAWILWAHTPSALAAGVLALAAVRGQRSTGWVAAGAIAAAAGVLLRSEGLLWAGAVALALIAGVGQPALPPRGDGDRRGRRAGAPRRAGLEGGDRGRLGRGGGDVACWRLGSHRAGLRDPHGAARRWDHLHHGKAVGAPRDRLHPQCTGGRAPTPCGCRRRAAGRRRGAPGRSPRRSSRSTPLPGSWWRLRCSLWPGVGDRPAPLTAGCRGPSAPTPSRLV